jgi:hypothetical protein
MKYILIKNLFKQIIKLNFYQKQLMILKSFIQIQKIKETFSVKEAISNALTILSADLKSNNIDLI